MLRRAESIRRTEVRVRVITSERSPYSRIAIKNGWEKCQRRLREGVKVENKKSGFQKTP